MASSVTVRAPAKVNLGLRIVGCREDGYHLLESLFVPLALADVLHFEFGAGAGVQLEVAPASSLPADTPLPVAADNLVTRAVEGFCALSGEAPRVSIRLEKAIPVGAGLGGGSSDAGAVLRVLAARDREGRVSPEALHALATRLGADVPFFLDPRPSQVSGIGENLQPSDDVPELPLVLVNPGQSLATAAVFEAFADTGAALTQAPPGSTMRTLEGPLGRKNAAESTDSTTRAQPHPTRPHGSRLQAESLAEAFDSGLLHNDLEAAATRLCPAIAESKRRLGDVGARWVAMSGSGATVYGIFDDQASAERANEELDAKPPVWTTVTRTTGQPGSSSTRRHQTTPGTGN
ncbi:MAG: 4-(cytidine 5'-diphospho)-2-C-methyl-D-erythritol kinase [Myxococcota bacterium]|nr:4-(cytidine 5'-diphospho)-2-C-methyl-D-erythritol kinase [Myxococcota bacterium]